METAKIWPGRPYPLGATYSGSGTNFSIVSEIAERVELCLIDDAGRETRFDLPETTAFCWHGYLPDVEPGQRYGYRVYGPWDPPNGLRCNPSKLLLDPYAKAIEGQVQWNEAVFSYDFNRPDQSKNEKDSAPFMPKSIVVNPFFEWDGDEPLKLSWHETVIYETHVKGLTMTHPDIPERMRGTFAGLAHPKMVGYLNNLGVTAVELLPVHQFVHDKTLVDRGLRNYWGYNSIGFLAPHNEYSSRGQKGQQVQEFKQLVKNLHRRGIEVILDVVYNHTAEGNQLGPTLCFKGIDNAAYYRLMADNSQYYMDYTGTGNSLNVRHPHVLQLIMDSLRYWVLEMHVDGFRFDLASTLARELHEVDKLSSFFDIVQQDPVISQVKLIAEPWDVGEGGYQVGNFPSMWSEWNGKYRDCVRDFWRGQGCTLGGYAYRLTGSSDLYESTGRRPFASVNFVTAHDGFTLTDLVSYNEKHNEANGEENKDGDNYNRSWNCGTEGTTDNPDILSLRAKQKRNLLATLFLSQGIPMIRGGDEISKSQNGNNNAYCQDNKLSWYNWDSADNQLLKFVTGLISFRRVHEIFHRPRWFQGSPIYRTGVDDIAWFLPEGKQMTDAEWGEAYAKSMAVFMNGQALRTFDDFGERVVDDTFYLLLNAHFEPIIFTIPEEKWGKIWGMVFTTEHEAFSNGDERFAPGSTLSIEGRSLTLLCRRE
jgi:glycogen operon protein